MNNVLHLSPSRRQRSRRFQTSPVPLSMVSPRHRSQSRSRGSERALFPLSPSRQSMESAAFSPSIITNDGVSLEDSSSYNNNTNVEPSLFPILPITVNMRPSSASSRSMTMVSNLTSPAPQSVQSQSLYVPSPSPIDFEFSPMPLPSDSVTTTQFSSSNGMQAISIEDHYEHTDEEEHFASYDSNPVSLVPSPAPEPPTPTSGSNCSTDALAEIMKKGGYTMWPTEVMSAWVGSLECVVSN